MNHQFPDSRSNSAQQAEPLQSEPDPVSLASATAFHQRPGSGPVAIQRDLLAAHEGLISLEMTHHQSVALSTEAIEDSFVSSLRRYCTGYFTPADSIITTVAGLKGLFLDGSSPEIHAHGLIQFRTSVGRYLLPRDDGAMSEFSEPAAIRFSVKLRSNDRNKMQPYLTEAKPLLSSAAFDEGARQVLEIDNRAISPGELSALPLLVADAMHQSRLNAAPNDDLVVRFITANSEACRFTVRTEEQQLHFDGKLLPTFQFVRWSWTSL